MKPSSTAAPRTTDLIRGFSASRRRVGLLLVLAVIAVLLLAQNSAAQIESYRLIGSRTLGLSVAVAPCSWTRVTSVTETAKDVRVAADTLPCPIPGPGTAPLEGRELIVHLAADLGDRTVADRLGAPIRKASTVPSVVLPSGAVPLPTFAPTVDGMPQACAGVGYAMDVRIHGSAVDPAFAWVDFPNGHRENLLWPPGFYAEFSPGITVFNSNGTIVAQENQLVTGGCPMEPGGLFIDLPTVADSPSPSR